MYYIYSGKLPASNVEDTMRALELGFVETLLCWENLDIHNSKIQFVEYRLHNLLLSIRLNKLCAICALPRCKT